MYGCSNNGINDSAGNNRNCRTVALVSIDDKRWTATKRTELRPSRIATTGITAAVVVTVALIVIASLSLSSCRYRCCWWWCVGASGSTARTTTAGCKLTGCGCCYLPAIFCLAAVITSLSLMRSRVTAFTDVNATTDLVQQHTAAGRDVVVVRDVVVEAATATVVIATADNVTTAADNVTTATADTLFRRPLLPPHRLPPPSPPPHQHHSPPPTPLLHQLPNQTDPTVSITPDNGRVHHQPHSLGTVMVLMVVTVVVLGTVGLLTCVLHHYNQQYDSAVHCLSASNGPHHHRLSTPPPPTSSSPLIKTIIVASPPPLTTQTSNSRNTSSRTAMLTMRSNNGLTRERDRQVRLHSVRTDLELDLPPRVHLPDSEEYPYGSMAKLHLRNPEQEQEIYKNCIRGPPNRTIWQSDSECGKLLQSHRSSSTSLSTSSSEMDSVTRCNSVSSRCLPRTGVPPVNNTQSLSSLTMVPCLSHVDKQTLRQ